HWQAAGDARLARTDACLALPDACLALPDARLVLPYCESCRRFHWPARARCPQCRGEMTWCHASGLGRVVTFSIVRRAVNPELEGDAPYAIAFVDLDEGVRLFTNIVDAQPDMLKAGMRVRCRFEATLDAALLVPVFAPVDDAPSPPPA
ncbi:MAG: Zn-ribbon domain-containing OB-fold protein, partial [Burkholderiales bacterium]